MKSMKREYDVDVVRHGSFTVWAESLEEAEQMVEDMTEDEIADYVTRWYETEVLGID